MQVGPFSPHTGNLSESCTAEQILSAAQGFFTTSVPTITDRHVEAATPTAANASGYNDSATMHILVSRLLFTHILLIQRTRT